MARQYIYFKDLPTTAIFSLNGNRCKKQSSRTLKLLDYNTWFYCTDKTVCIVGNYSAL